MPIVLWSFITFSVPIVAASTNGKSSVNHGVLIILSCPSGSVYPILSGVTKPTQSINLKLVVISSILILAPLEGTNLGSTVIICFPPDV